ncbi:DegT/DnrJ/EryC1/StrS family aminotransferase [Prochlorococcus marinus]|nr:DegT/DnrJ/EryC1/StrS aminotransferase family protein [Prochlorococcus marinus]
MKDTFIEEYKTKLALSEFILSSNKLSMGIKCSEFEKEFSIYQGRKDSILFNSGGSANLALLQSLKNLGRLKNNSKVGFSALTWSTNVMPIIQLGMEPIALDCDPKTLNVMSKNIIDVIDNLNLDAIFLTNVLGFTGDLDKIKEICDARNIILIEDNCEALGSIVSGKKSGNYGLASTFSFFVAHHMSTIEGGMVTTDDNDLEEMLRMVRSNGWDRNLNSDQKFKIRKTHNILSEFDSKYSFYDLGYNLRPTEITGFLGLNQLKYLNENIKKRNSNHLVLNSVVVDNTDLQSINYDHQDFLSPFAFPVVCKSAEIKNFYFNQFSGAGVEIRPMIAGNIQFQPFYKKYSKYSTSCPGADFLTSNSFYCGNYPGLSTSDLEIIKNCLKKY